jgi:hypothetical protein
MRIILKFILKAPSQRLWIDILWLGIRSSYGEYVHEYVGFINSGQLTDQVREC